ncbi:hypothetical protein ABIG06_000514 [Bradyrhizobium sp. USDA 326]
MTNELRQLQRLARAQAAFAGETRAKSAFLEIREHLDASRPANDNQVEEHSLEPFPEGWWASP